MHELNIQCSSFTKLLLLRIFRWLMCNEPFRLLRHLAKGRLLPLLLFLFQIEVCVAVRLYFPLL